MLPRKNLIRLLVIMIILLVQTNGVHSQTKSTETGRLITPVERDSIVSKLIRGEHYSVQVKDLQKALQSCDSVKSIYKNIINVQTSIKDSLYLVNSYNDGIIKNLELNVKAEKARGRRKWFFGFLEGTAVGAFIILILSII